MRNKIFVFVVGLVAGVTIGVLFSVAIKELVFQFKELHISLNRINLKQSQLSQKIDSMQAKLVPENKKGVTINTSNKAKAITATAVKPAETKEIKPEDLKTANSTSAHITEDDSDVVVMTNELVSVLMVPLKNSDTTKTNKKIRKTDSTIAALSEVGDSSTNTNYRIEFWKSPLNYKGYKMSTGKLILYGINPVTPVRLVLQEGGYYLLINQNAYKVDFTDDYKPFERVTDKIALKKLEYEN